MFRIAANPWLALGLPVVLVVAVAVLAAMLPHFLTNETAEPVAGSPATLRLKMGMELVLVPGGEFAMGSSEAGLPAERPQRTVRVEPFYLGRYEVTQAQWRAVMGENPSAIKDPRRPVEQVTWEQAQEFVGRLNRLENTNKYRLPTEAEWEYAARAGSTTAYPRGDDAQGLEEFAWFGQQGNVGTRPVGQRRPNAFGLYDMLGNVWEWVQDCWVADYAGAPQDGRPQLNGDCSVRVLRGGGWNSEAAYVRFAVRGSYVPDLNDPSNGLRLARSP